MCASEHACGHYVYASLLLYNVTVSSFFDFYL